ncbi:hypothetical protein [Thalassobacillus pellis]|uniref:hypothetical protein n=1 Tax=Thalassobacillus pellis TaxID=748008 RepID=UPI001EF8B905|nr:hypothetical protein [Thalassobacillus pellis]MBM7553551.1 hypothetical protein [Thalassobacillus pellis]
MLIGTQGSPFTIDNTPIIATYFHIGNGKNPIIEWGKVLIHKLCHEVMEMNKKTKKKFEFPTETNTHSSIGVQAGLRSDQPLDAEDSLEGESVDKHEKLEAANEEIAAKEISQVYNNS